MLPKKHGDSNALQKKLQPLDYITKMALLLLFFPYQKIKAFFSLFQILDSLVFPSEYLVLQTKKNHYTQKTQKKVFKSHIMLEKSNFSGNVLSCYLTRCNAGQPSATGIALSHSRTRSSACRPLGSQHRCAEWIRSFYRLFTWTRTRISECTGRATCFELIDAWRFLMLNLEQPLQTVVE